MSTTLVTDISLRKAMLHALADDQQVRILGALAREPLSTTDLIHRELLPTSSAYRHIRDLLAHGLIVIHRTIVRPDGKVYQTYRSAYTDVKVSLHAGEVVVEAELATRTMDRAFRAFHSFGEG